MSRKLQVETTSIRVPLTSNWTPDSKIVHQGQCQPNKDGESWPFIFGFTRNSWKFSNFKSSKYKIVCSMFTRGVEL